MKWITREKVKVDRVAVMPGAVGRPVVAAGPEATFFAAFSAGAAGFAFDALWSPADTPTGVVKMGKTRTA